MKKLNITVIPVILFLLFLTSSADTVELIYFYETACPECAKLEDFFKHRIKPNYPVSIKKHEIHAPGNAELLLQLAQFFEAEDILKKGTPALFIGKNAFQGSSRRIQREIETAVRLALREKTASPLKLLDQKDSQVKIQRRLTLPAVLGAAAVDAINPCACAVLVLLLGTIILASRGKKRRILGAGLAFTGACYISYFLMGLGLFSALKISGIQRIIYKITACLAIIIGAWNIKDSIFPGNRFRIEVPPTWQPLLKRLTSSITSIPGAFFTGLLISLFLLPCTSGPYVVIIGMLSQTASRIQAVWLLLLYNLIFIIPFILITLGVGLGFTTTARVERWRQDKLPRFHLITGIFMLILGIILVIFLS